MTSGEGDASAPDAKQLYKSLIDQLAETARDSVIANRICRWGHPERDNADALPYRLQEERRVALFSALSVEQRDMVADLLEEERKGAVHDVAALIEWLTTSQSLQLSWHGQVLPDSPFGSYHYDLVCRLNGDAWPDERDTERH